MSVLVLSSHRITYQAVGRFGGVVSCGALVNRKILVLQSELDCDLRSLTVMPAGLQSVDGGMAGQFQQGEVQ
jgi:hypothetical protein